MARKIKRVTASDEEIEIPKYKTISPLNQEQADCIKQIHRNNIILIIGKAGSGKTAISSGIGAEYLQRNLVDRLILSRPCIGSEDLGYLPGEMREKIDPYLQPLFTELGQFINVKTCIAQEKVSILPVSYMRGVTFKNSFVIIDEAQNMDYRQLKLVLTRYGENSKLVIMGDVTQSDLDNKQAVDFSRVIDKLRKVAAIPENKIAIVELTISVRHPIIKVILDALES